MEYNIMNANIKQNIRINRYLNKIKLLESDNNVITTEEEFNSIYKKWERQIMALHKYLKINGLELIDVEGNRV